MGIGKGIGSRATLHDHYVCPFTVIVFGTPRPVDLATAMVGVAAQGGERRAQLRTMLVVVLGKSFPLARPSPPLAVFRRGRKGQSDWPIARKIPRINRVRYWRPLSGLFLFLRRVSPDREGGIIAALPSFNNLIAVGPGDPVGNPLLQPRTKINNLTAVLAGSLI